MNTIAVLKLNGVDAKEHAVFQELARVKHYFEKIKSAETSGPAKRKLDGAAATRFISRALVSHSSIATAYGALISLKAGNDKHDGEMPNKLVQDQRNAQNKNPPISHPYSSSLESKSPRKRMATDALSTSSSSAFSSHAQAKNEELVDVAESNQLSIIPQEGIVETTRRRSRPAELSTTAAASQSPRVGKRAKESIKGGHRKKKSTKVPRDGKDVFNDLLSRS